jgi:hypothetical protein
MKLVPIWETMGSIVCIEGYSVDELLALPKHELDALVFPGRPVVARVGSAEVLVECKQDGDTLIVDLAHIDGGGEGALPTVVGFIERYAKSRRFRAIEWLVRATRCANPNPKLQRVLLRKGFAIREHPDFGECYYRKTTVGSDPV